MSTVIPLLLIVGVFAVMMYFRRSWSPKTRLMVAAAGAVGMIVLLAGSTAPTWAWIVMGAIFAGAVWKAAADYRVVAA